MWIPDIPMRIGPHRYSGMTVTGIAFVVFVIPECKRGRPAFAYPESTSNIPLCNGFEIHNMAEPTMIF